MPMLILGRKYSHYFNVIIYVVKKFSMDVCIKFNIELLANKSNWMPITVFT